MKKQNLLSLALFLAIITPTFAQNTYHLVPLPARLIEKEGSFKLQQGLKINVIGDVATKQVIQNFVTQLNTASGLGLQVQANKPSNVVFSLVKNTSLDEEGYRLSIKPDKISVEAETPQGFFYATQTLLQLLPVAAFSPKTIAGQIWTLPCCDITDRPRYAYRGLHLDVGRHFFPVSFIKRYIDLLAMHKMNVFHWHLTEDQGWRIEIKKYPKLTQVGSQRKQTLEGNYAQNYPQKFDGKQYGGYYTQAEVKEVVAYAQSKYVTVIPEIELPGHAQAALAAYPELGCEPKKAYEVATSWGVFTDVFCPSEKTFKFLEDVLTEVTTLFPSKYIHIGGDECPKDAWKKSAFCQELIKKQGLKDEHELQSYFIKKIDKFITAKGRKMIGWDEILEGGLSPNATVMSWRGIDGGIAAARQHHDVIMTPTDFCYLDYYQADPAQEPMAIGGYLPIEKVYSYEPTPLDLSADLEKHILGAQCNLWTEYVTTPEQAEYMVFPRATAMAEVVWSPKGSKNWEDFSSRLEAHLKRLDQLKVNYSKALFDVRATTSFNDQNQFQVVLKSNSASGNVYYTTDGKEPNEKSTEYIKPIVLSKSATIKAYSPNGRPWQRSYRIHKALGKGYTLNGQTYSYADKTNQLTNGIAGSNPQDRRSFMLVNGNDIEIVLDLGDVMSVGKVSTHFLKVIASDIFPPIQAEVSVSKDGVEYKDTAIMPIKYDLEGEWKIEQVEVPCKSARGRYVRLRFKNAGTCPNTHPHAGAKTNIGIDEIQVE